ncbi:hypothetical protein CPLU01_15394 [Colletotrichum plurivorum]|uniref:Uncharacterized protein n=1 Tax=Colletotrichum plurivorum TaxID=2175906 RepID=A0A8H6MUZ0_9PEZI|nr:hypothetical protein CPLU01_15394 [Colletotrichum plurivorum]
MGPRRSRRDVSSDEVQTKRQEEAKRRLQEKLYAQASGGVTRNRALAPKSRKSRDALWEASVSYFRDVACRDHKQVWLGLCLDEPEAETICKDFLEYYLLRSEDRRLVFGPQVLEEKLSITCVNTIESRLLNREINKPLSRFLLEPRYWAGFLRCNAVPVFNGDPAWPAWRAAIPELLVTSPIYPWIDPRFRYGELRLSRLNKVYFLTSN